MHYTIKKILFFCLSWYFLTSTAILTAQNKPLQFSSLTKEDGLSQSFSRGIFQDSKGFLWFLTNDGLNRYDGKNIKVFRHLRQDTTSLSNSAITSIEEDKQGQIWVGTIFGLNKYNPKTETFTRINMGKLSKEGRFIIDIEIDAEGYIWFGTYNGLVRLDPTNQSIVQFKPIPDNPNSLSTHVVWSIYKTQKGELWVGTNKGMDVLHYSNKENRFEFEHYGPKPDQTDALQSTKVWAFKKDRQGNIWIATRHGIAKVNRTPNNKLKFKTYLNKPTKGIDLAYYFIYDLHIDRHNQLWAGTYNAGLITADLNQSPLQFKQYQSDITDPKSLLSNEVRIFKEDNAGIMWIGTAVGINYFDPYANKFPIIKHDKLDSTSLGGEKITAILKDSHGNLWVGSREKGLSFQSANSQQFFRFSANPNDPMALPSNQIRRIYEDSQGYIWINSFQGVSVANPKDFPHQPKFRTFSVKDGIYHYITHRILEIRPNEYWLLTYANLYKMYFDPTQNKKPVFEIFLDNGQQTCGIVNNLCYDVAKDKYGQYWFGTFSGLAKSIPDNRKDNHCFDNYIQDANDPRSLSNDRVFVLHKDRQDRLWVGTQGGLNYVHQVNDKDRVWFTIFGLEEGFPSESINSILEDDAGLFWIGTNDGLVVFDPDAALDGNSATSCIVKIYDDKDGLISRELPGWASTKDKNGQLYFGATGGINVIQPKHILKNPFLPPVVLTGIKVNNRSITDFRQDSTEHITTTAAPFLKNMMLKHHQNDLSIEFAALSFSNATRNQYAFKLIGYDQKWKYIARQQDENEAHYTNLDPGDYTFIIKAANGDGIWNETLTTLKITILPPFWKTWWAYAFYLLAFAGLIAGVIRYRVNQKTRLVQEKARIERARMEERDQFRRKNAADFHDELGHDLTKIALFIDLAKREANGTARLKTYLTKTESYVKELSSGIRDFIWALDPDKDSMMHTLLRLQEFGDELFDFTPVKFQVHGIDAAFENIKLTQDTRRQILLIFKEVMNNCLKHARCENAIFRNAIEKDSLIVAFSDDGQGFDDSKIYDGYGLKNIQNRAKKIGSQLIIQTQEKIGTTITLKIPHYTL